MLIVISPAKTLDFESPLPSENFSQPDLLDESQLLINRLKDLSSIDLMELMHISSKIADLNVDRNHQWQKPFNPDNARPSAFAFKGDVYTGLQAETLDEAELEFAQQHLRILSGLYGLLRPLDLMQAYRLEMGSKLNNLRGKNLYEFWGNRITDKLNQQLQALNSNTLVNLASNEYFKSVKPKQLNAEIITPAFKEYRNGSYKMISFYAKKARGLMTRFAIQNRISDVESLKDFDVEGYRYNPQLSLADQWVFTRNEA